jgi:hypothetical protein
MCSAISAHGRENWSITARDTPRMSAVPFSTSFHSTPSRSVSSARSTAW